MASPYHVYVITFEENKVAKDPVVGRITFGSNSQARRKAIQDPIAAANEIIVLRNMVNGLLLQLKDAARLLDEAIHLIPTGTDPEWEEEVAVFLSQEDNT